MIPGTHLNISLIQMFCQKAAKSANIKGLSDYISEAEARGIDIIGFPEMSITGYADPAKYPEAIISLDGPEMTTVLDLTKGRAITALVGLIEENPAGKPFITQAAVRNGQILGHYRKQTIIDEEADWFTPGNNITVFHHGDLTFGIALCADIRHEALFAEYARCGAQIVFELAAPGLYGEQAARDWPAGFQWWEGECRKYLEVYAQKYGIWIAVATQAGRTVDEDFPGGGYVFAPNGWRVYATPDWSPGAAYLALDLKACRVSEL